MAGSEAPVTSALRRAALRATHAWSVFGTQPWRLELHATHLDVVADANRRLETLDPSGRLIAASLGAFLYDVRVSLAAAEWQPVVERLPLPARPELVARVHLDADDQDGMVEAIAAHEAVLAGRPGEATAFTSGVLAPDVVAALAAAAAHEQSELFAVDEPALARRVFDLCRHARDIQLVDPACRAELRAWTGQAAQESAHADPVSAPTQFVLGSRRDDRLAWGRAGEALERVLLTLTAHGLVASTTACAVEVPSTRIDLRGELGVEWFPHLVVRVGQGSAPPLPRRRRLVDVLFEDA
jgi:hypothetical protein